MIVSPSETERGTESCPSGEPPSGADGVDAEEAVGLDGFVRKRSQIAAPGIVGQTELSQGNGFIGGIIQLDIVLVGSSLTDGRARVHGTDFIDPELTDGAGGPCVSELPEQEGAEAGEQSQGYEKNRQQKAGSYGGGLHSVSSLSKSRISPL